MTRYRHLITEGNRKWWTLGAMCFALFMIMLDNTVVNVALPSIQRDLGASISGLEWIVNGYMLSFAVLLATGGRLGDIFGRRRMFLAGVVVFALSSATAGFAVSATDLVASRVVQGVGAALMMPATLSIVTDAFSPEERGKAMGTWAGVSGLALAVGPVVGGLLTEHVSWRAIFYLNVPVAAGAVAASLFAVRESRDSTVGREVDFAGVATLTAGLSALVLALVEGNAWGWGSTAIVSLLVGAALALVLFVVVELRVRAPMVEFRFFADRIGPRWLIVAGLLVIAASLYSFSGIAVDSTYLELLPGFMLLGVGIALTMSPMTSAAMNAVPVEKAGIASGVLSMFRMVGGSLGVAVTGAIFQGSVGASFAAATPQDFVDALGYAMAVCAVVAAAGAAIGAVAIRAHRGAPLSAGAAVGPGGEEPAGVARSGDRPGPAVATSRP